MSQQFVCLQVVFKAPAEKPSAVSSSVPTLQYTVNTSKLREVYLKMKSMILILPLFPHPAEH